MPADTLMGRLALRGPSYVRYLNIFLVIFFLSDIPMPVNKSVLALCCGVNLLGNFLIHLYSHFSRQPRVATYMLLLMDLLTTMPAIYYSGTFGSPFILFLPLIIYNVFFLGLTIRAAAIFSGLAVGLFLGLIGYSWHHILSHPIWTPAQFPEYAAFVVLLQLSALGIIIYQAWRGPGSIIRELRSKEALLSEEMPRARLGTSISMIAHEIRNPMTTIALTLEQCKMIAKGAPPPIRRKLAKSWKVCGNEIARIDRMLDNVLAYSRHDAGKYSISPVPARKVIDRAIQFTRQKHIVQQMSFSTICTVTKTQILCCDPEAMHQVLTNIFDNAIQNRKPIERLRLEISMIQDTKSATLNIVDNGSGIAPERLPSIFDNFSSARLGGTGLGLAIARRIIHAHRGSIDVKSAQGAGTTFVIRLPANPPSTPDD